MLSGIIPPLVTPLTAEYALDQPAMSKILRHVLDGGVHGLFVLGTTGEAPSLSDATKTALLEQMRSEVGDQVPWLVGITDPCLTNAVRWAEQAERSGATAVVAAPPYYYPLEQAALCNYFQQLAKASPLPLFLYNIPSHARQHLAHDTVLAILQLPNVIGYKDSTGNMMAFHYLRQQWPHQDKSYLVGPEELLLETVLLGGQGGVNGGAIIFPTLYVRLFEAAQQGRLGEARKLHQRVLQISHQLYQKGRTVISGIKFALAERGLCSESLAPPLPSLTDEEKLSMRAFLRAFDEEFATD